MLICVDEKLKKEEVKTVKNIGLNLGLNPELVKVYLNELEDLKYWEGEFPDLMAIFKINHN